MGTDVPAGSVRVEVPEAGRFIRIHRSLIVNVERIRELHRESDGSGFIVLRDGVRLRVARGRWESLQAALEMEEF